MSDVGDKIQAAHDMLLLWTTGSATQNGLERFDRG